MIIRIITITMILTCFNVIAYAKYENLEARNYYNNTYVELHQEGKNQEALEILKEWSQKYPDDATVYGYWGFLLLEKGNNEESLPKFEKATQLAPNYDAAFRGWGEALYNLGRYKEAKDKFEKYVKMFPDSYAYYYLGRTLYMLEEYDEALKNFEKVPDNQAVDIDNTEVIEKSNKYIELIKNKKKSAIP